MSHSDERQEKAVGRYFEGVAKKWFDLAYDPGGNFSTFPTGKIRQDITIEEIRRLQAGRKVMDLGCGTGQLVIELLTKGYFALGIDGSRRMITIARSFLKKRLPNADGQQIFRIANVLDFVPEESFDVITAMGLLEYLTDDHAFFE
ncbi:MAG TPA: class I SAM-dependent methyltransferase, partial [Candidatus Bathyarchaeia archaeon]|nr:class I SAM-dependent methyltransferase [Candidatus Bathyarchaeia archaeon]